MRQRLKSCSEKIQRLWLTPREQVLWNESGSLLSYWTRGSGGIGCLVAFSTSNILSVVFDDWTPPLGGKMGFKHSPERRSSRLWIVKEEDLFIQMARKVFTPRARRNGGRFATAAQQSQAIERRASLRNGETEAAASTLGSAEDPDVVPSATRAGAEREQF